MGIKVKNIGLIGLGMLAGVAATMQFPALAQRAAAPLPLDELRQLADVFGLIKTDYVEKVEDKKLLTEAISGMVASLDPHSVYLDKNAFKDMRDSVQGKFVGIGIEVSMEDGYVKVVSPIEDSPATRAGILAGDLITRLDNVPLKGLQLDEVIKKMRGQPNSKLVLTISRKGEAQPLVFPIVREEIRVQSVKAKMVAPGYGWLRIAQFQEPTLGDMVKKINGLYAQDPKLKGLVLDLRNDPGGVLPGAIGVSAAFLPGNSVIVSTRGQLPESQQVFYGRREFYAAPGSKADPLARLPAALKTVPLVVLVNTGSASAAEIVAGALQDYGRATVIGTQTFGKGSVQTLRQLTADTAIKLTTARYYTPKGRAIQARGITPDLLVDETLEGDGWNTLRVREADLDKHLSSDDGKPEATRPTMGEVHDQLEQEKRLIADAKTRKRLEYGAQDDFQLQQALNHFKGLPVKLAKVDNKAEKIVDKPEIASDIKAEDKKAPVSQP
ncbi:S41 family peptidase [Janthinobacterium aquaticum]|uniref:S41 family peptidase n=1 Tax=Janthinobacterium sp. FT58W TaxID=2654254 RepID=UPI0012649E55|nr:S41 family peptidase [Janthinobacterium sp. FT58W]KAB8040204.1 PDZ domain-containing protein [Janthinobacterium sp. FT58W]